MRMLLLLVVVVIVVTGAVDDITKYEKEQHDHHITRSTISKKKTNLTCRILGVAVQTGRKRVKSEEEPDLVCIFEDGIDREDVARDLIHEIDGLPKEFVRKNRDELESGNYYIEMSSATRVQCRDSEDVGCTDRVMIRPDSVVNLIPAKEEEEEEGKIEEYNPKEQSNNITPAPKVIRRTGTSSILVLRVTGNDSSPKKNASELSDGIFGTHGDHVNLVSQYAACSNGQLRFVMATGPQIVDGVAEIKVDMNMNNTNMYRAENVVTVAATAAIDGFPDAFDHVMYCMPPGLGRKYDGSGRWIGYGYYNLYRTVYNNNWCSSVSLTMHEIGHNLNLYHSSEGIKEYGDKSGLMGSSSKRTDGPRMCFNAAKSWILGWYSDRHLSVQPSLEGVDMKLAGIVDYANNETVTGVHTVVAEIVKPGATNLYMMLNRDEGFNEGTKEFKDEVTIVESPLLGRSFVVSSLLPSEKHRIPSIYEHDLVIEVCRMVLGRPDYAEVLVYLDNGIDDVPTCRTLPRVAPTNFPTFVPFPPTSSPTIITTTIPANPEIAYTLSYEFEHNTLDSSPNNMTGLAIGQPLYLTDDDDDDDTVGTYLKLNQTGSDKQYVVLGHQHPPIIFGPDRDFTISFWVKTQRNFSLNYHFDPAIISNKDWSDAFNKGWVIAANINGGWQWNIADGKHHRADYQSPEGWLNDGQWHHILVTHQRTGDAKSRVARFYHDGINVGMENISHLLGDVSSSDLKIHVGTDAAPGDHVKYAFFNGSLDKVEIYFGVALDQDVVRSMYLSGRKPSIVSDY